MSNGGRKVEDRLSEEHVECKVSEGKRKMIHTLSYPLF